MVKKETEKLIIDEINNVYKKLIRKTKQSTFLDYKNVELHVHTPASHDYIFADKNNEEEVEYRLLLNKIINSNLDVIAITDHNNIKGYEKLKQIIREDDSIRDRLKNKLLLPGIEIDCYGNHFLAIFDNEINIDKIASFIYHCGLENRDDIEQSADRVTPLLLCEEVYKLNGIVILAHADVKKGFMQSYFKSRDNLKEINDFEIIGKTVQSVLNSKSLLAISINNIKNIEHCKSLLSNWKIENIKLVQASDSHSSLDFYEGSGKPFGTKSCWVKMGTLTFKSFQMALKQQNNEVYFKKPSINKNIYMHGIAVKGGFLINANKNKNDFSIFTFSPDLNCLIGPRGTGKSTIIEIIDYITNFENYYTKEINEEKEQNHFELAPSHKDPGRYVINRFNTAIIFINYDENLYAIHSNPKGFSIPNISLYYLDKAKNTFRRTAHCKKLNTNDMYRFIKKREQFKIKVYKQKDLQEMTSSSSGVTKLIDKLNVTGLGTDYLEKKMLLKKMYKEIKDICSTMFKERLSDDNADWNDIELDKKYKEYCSIYSDYIQMYKTSIDNLNTKLNGKLQLSYEIKFDNELLQEISKNIALQYERKKGNNYELEANMKKNFYNLIFNNISVCPNLLYLMFTHNHKEIYSSLNLSMYNIKEDDIEILVDKLWNSINQDYVALLPYPIIDFKLNVNYEMKPKEIYVDRNKLSFGQKTVGALLLIMQGATEFGDKLPLIIDQPEDDLDNSYIYHMLIKQFYTVKENKQLLIATHNPNIPVCGEAENIIVLESDGNNGWIECSGSVDVSTISNAVLRILEGDFEAFKRRAEVYGFELINTSKSKLS